MLRGQRPIIRSDGLYVRDYFYVEDGAAAYMLLAEQLAAQPELHGQAFNFSNEIQVAVGPGAADPQPMEGPTWSWMRNEATNEIRRQYLSATKARQLLNWEPMFSLTAGLQRTIDWYQAFLEETYYC